MSRYRVKDFTYEKDFPISTTCVECGYYTEDKKYFDFWSVCPKCSGGLRDKTYHLDCKCKICKRPLDLYENAYRHNENSNILICQVCYAEIEHKQ